MLELCLSRCPVFLLFLTNYFNQSKVIKPLRCKVLLIVKETEKTLWINKDNKRTIFKKTDDDDWHCI